MAVNARRGTPKRAWISLLQPFWSLTILTLVAVFFWRQRTEITQAIHELRLADWHWLVLIVASSLLMHCCLTQALSDIFLRLGRRIPFVSALMTHGEREMVAAVMPLGGAASYVTLASRFGVYGVTRNDAALATLVYSVIGHLSFIAVAIPAMIVLLAGHNATEPILLGAVLFLVVAIMLMLTVTAMLRGKRLRLLSNGGPRALFESSSRSHNRRRFLLGLWSNRSRFR